MDSLEGVVIGLVAAVVIVLVVVFGGLFRSGSWFPRGILSRRSSGEIKPTGPEGMVGETAVVTRPVGDLHAGGTVRGRGENWPAYTDQSEPIEVGKTVLLIDFVRGKFLVVESDSTLPL